MVKVRDRIHWGLGDGVVGVDRIHIRGRLCVSCGVRITVRARDPQEFELRLLTVEVQC